MLPERPLGLHSRGVVHEAAAHIVMLLDGDQGWYKPGTIAGAAQAALGNVVAGSPFAIMQSAAMGGYGVAIADGVVQGAGLLVTGVSVAEGWISGHWKDKR